MLTRQLPPVKVSMPSDQPRDEDLVIQAQAGDEAAFAELVHRHEHRVYTLALRMLRNPADAEDALQDTFISALNGLKNFRREATFATWLYRIAYNATLMRLRKPPAAASLDEAMERDENAMPRELTDWSHDPEAALLNKETREAMDAAVAALPETLRSIFLLRDVDGLSTEEAAAVLNISIEATKVRLHRARLALRDKLSNYFSAPRVTEKELH